MTIRRKVEHKGLALRSRLGRSALADLPKRKFDPVQVLLEACRQHIASLLPLKFKLMSASPFVFFRGSVELMAADLGAARHTGIEVQICGDAHVKNFGFFATPGSDIVLDVNDFDETQRGPWEWDVKRLATSIILAGRVAHNPDDCCKEAVRVFLSDYCKWMRRFAAMPALEVARHREESKAVLDALGDYRATLAPDRQLLFDSYKPVDVGFKVVGTGSVGTRDYVVLFLNRDRGESDPLFLQIKEEPPSAYAPFYKDRSAPLHQGERVVRGQRALQVFSDLLLGWCSIAGRDYLVRQLSDHKSSVEPEDLKGDRLIEYGNESGTERELERE